MGIFDLPIADIKVIITYLLNKSQTQYSLKNVLQATINVLKYAVDNLVPDQKPQWLAKSVETEADMVAALQSLVDEDGFKEKAFELPAWLIPLLLKVLDMLLGKTNVPHTPV